MKKEKKNTIEIHGIKRARTGGRYKQEGGLERANRTVKLVVRCRKCTIFDPREMMLDAVGNFGLENEDMVTFRFHFDGAAIGATVFGFSV